MTATMDPSNEVQPHDCNDIEVKPRPDSVVFKPAFVELNDGIGEVKTLHLQPLLDSEYENVVTRDLVAEVNNRTKDEAPEETKFAVSGDVASDMNLL